MLTYHILSPNRTDTEWEHRMYVTAPLYVDSENKKHCTIRGEHIKVPGGDFITPFAQGLMRLLMPTEQQHASS